MKLCGVVWKFLWCLWTSTSEIILITSEGTDYEFSAAIFIELLKFWCEVLTIFLGCIRMSGDISGAQLAGRRRGVSPALFKNWKDYPNNRKNALILFIHGLNMFIYALISDAVSRVLRKKNCGAFFHVL